MSNAEKIRENRLRRMAERKGLRLEKARTRDPNATNFGTYQLTDPYLNALVWGDHNRGYGLDLDEVEALLAKGSEWERTLRKALGIADIAADETVMDAALEVVLGPYAIYLSDSSQRQQAPVTQARQLIEVILERASLGQLDDMVRGRGLSITQTAHELNLATFGAKGARAIEEGGGAGPLLEKLITYVRENLSR